MKLLFVVSSLDLTQPFSATPAWWMLLKGLYETGVEVIATPYQGPAIESLWWRAEPNPAQWQGDAFRATRDVLRRLRPPASPAQTGSAAMPGEVTDSDDTISADDVHDDESVFDRLTRQTAHALIAPLWFRHLDRILTREGDVDAVIVLTVPLNHLTGVPERIRQKHGVPVFYYDGDVPASLPDMKGFASGFRIYQGSRPEEYTAFISNSQGGATHLRRLGAREVHTLFYAADPDVYAPIAVDAQDIDAFFYGHGAEYRAEWIAAMLDAPSRAMPDARFAVRGTRLGALPQVEQLPYLSFSKLREYACRSRLNLCITRGAHASVFASSSMRPFELAAMGCCIVANPYDGLETWFEPGREIIVVHSAEQAIEQYRELLANPQRRADIGQAARQRVLKQHTFRHRAEELKRIVGLYTQGQA